MAGGSYLVARKIAMLIETWDRVRLSEQETIIGRDKGDGRSALGRRRVHRARLRRADAGPPMIAIAATCGSRTPTPTTASGILRRGYNFVDGNNDLGRLDAGLFFLSYQRSPEQFIALQRRAVDRPAERVHPARRLGDVRDPARGDLGSFVADGLFA